MANLKLHIELNKGKRGISLDKLEKVVQEMRRFLESMSDDIELAEPDSWVGVDFTNGSMGFAGEYSHEVPSQKLTRFNDAIMTLAKSEFPQSIQRSTANKFFELAAMLERGETADISVFDEHRNPIPMQVSNMTETIARRIKELPFRESLGAIQGKIHSLYKESKPHPYFTLRELSTGDLIKCLYDVEMYSTIVRALGEIDQVLHVGGVIVTDTRGRSINHVKVREVILAEPYRYEDVERFLGANGRR